MKKPKLVKAAGIEGIAQRQLYQKKMIKYLKWEIKILLAVFGGDYYPD